jgi:hypothetical protein
LLAAVARRLGGATGQAALRLTPPDLPGARYPHGCRKCLQVRFGDVALHNDGKEAYAYRTKEVTKDGEVEKRQVLLPGRLPSCWKRAFADHAEMLEAEARHPSSGHMVSMHTVGHAVGWS